MLMKKSSTPENYYEDSVIEMLTVEIQEIQKYLANFCNKKELSEVLGNLIVEEFKKHLESLAIESEIHPTIYRESLFDKTCDTITNALDELGEHKEALSIQAMTKELKNKTA